MTETTDNFFFLKGPTAVFSVSPDWPPGWTPSDLYDALKMAWSADTCAPRLRAQWKPENPTVGQCSVTAFLAQDVFGGEVFGVPLPDGHFHCYNRVGGTVFDLTDAQFLPEKLSYPCDHPQSREIHFGSPEKKARYELLSARVLEVAKTGSLRSVKRLEI